MTLVEPTASDEMVSVALPALSCIVPSTIFPDVKVTGPVGITVGDVIFAVKVTASPCVDGLGDEVSVALLVVSNTTWVRTVDVLP